MTTPILDPEDAAAAVARLVLEGFDKHYRIYGWATKAAQLYFERGDYGAIARTQTQRIDFYDARVHECVVRLRDELGATALDERIWGRVKLRYVGLLTDHPQPELAETFFNSVSCRILNRSYFDNRFLFVRPSISTEHMEPDPPAYRCYYPRGAGLRATLRRILGDFHFGAPFADLDRDLAALVRAVRGMIPRPLVLEANHQVQVLASPFFRGTTAFIVGKVINGDGVYPFAAAIIRRSDGQLALDALIADPQHLAILFSASRAYFLVEMGVPSAYVEFLRGIMPSKPKWELYTMLGLQKAGKSLFYRDFLHHLRYSSDQFVLAPGTKGLVMIVFTLPSFPYVFKVIRDRPAPPKDTDREQVKAKYRLVKHHDRAGRMADTLEYSDVVFPRARLDPALIAELQALAPSLFDEEGDRVIIKHLYIERRMVPLNLYLDSASDAEVEQVMREYGQTLRDLAATNIFAGDLLLKNFGVTRFGRVVFYDYDEIDYLTELNFRDLPKPRDDADELSGEPWFSVGPKDVFPEEFARFLLPDARTREAFLRHHQELLDPHWWRGIQRRIREERVVPILQYAPHLRLAERPRRRRIAALRTPTDRQFIGVIPD